MEACHIIEGGVQAEVRDCLYRRNDADRQRQNIMSAKGQVQLDSKVKKAS